MILSFKRLSFIVTLVFNNFKAALSFFISSFVVSETGNLSPSVKLKVMNRIIETLRNKRNGFAYVCLLPSLNSRAKTPGFVKIEIIELRNLES